ncbi:MAG TPA: hypothetical protein VGK14_14105 [Novimethylophilus sp.]|jgi:hypothetical protein
MLKVILFWQQHAIHAPCIFSIIGKHSNWNVGVHDVRVKLSSLAGCRAGKVSVMEREESPSTCKQILIALNDEKK